ncbi:hypothetical protein HYU22_04955 [Candidatus Woesearchaeota archaeon]|nr:hypothetical protein [Candidatus Woesearchaeota archaeon]
MAKNYAWYSLAVAVACSGTQAVRPSTMPSFRDACEYIQRHPLGENNRNLSDLVANCGAFLSYITYEANARTIIVNLSLGYSAMAALRKDIHFDIRRLGVQYSGGEPTCENVRGELMSTAIRIEDNLPRLERQIETNAPNITRLREYREAQRSTRLDVARLRRDITNFRCRER